MTCDIAENSKSSSEKTSLKEEFDHDSGKKDSHRGTLTLTPSFSMPH